MSVEKRRYGRSGHGYKVDGKKVPGVTTIIGAALPKPALIGWASGVAAEFVGDRLRLEDGHWIADSVVEDLRVMANESDDSRDHWPDGRVGALTIAKSIKALPFLMRDQAANRGTEVHKLAEQLAHGDEVQVPEELAGHVDSYIRFLDEWEPHDALVEVVVAHRTLKYCGTFDLLCEIDGLGRCLLDIKTNRSGPFGETALQLVAYKRAEIYLDPDSGDEVPMPEVDFTGVIWVRADGYDLIPFETGEREFLAFRYAYEVARWLKGPELFGDKETPSPERSVKGTALRPPTRKAVAS